MAGRQDGDRARVLIGEDTPDLAEAFMRILSRAGYAVRIEPDGPSVLTAALIDVPDVLLLDVAMPGMSGLQVCQAVRANPRTATVPVMMVSAFAMQTDMATGRAAGADEYLVKPFENKQLVAKVAALLERSTGAGGM